MQTAIFNPVYEEDGVCMNPLFGEPMEIIQTQADGQEQELDGSPTEALPSSEVCGPQVEVASAVEELSVVACDLSEALSSSSVCKKLPVSMVR